MSTPFTVRYDPQDKVLHWTMSGFWTLETVRDFALAMRDVVSRVGPPPLAFDSLCDSTSFPVQSPEVAAGLKAILDAGKAVRTGRTAIVVGSSLNRMQAGRTLIDPDLRIFMSMDEAKAWLRSKQENAA